MYCKVDFGMSRPGTFTPRISCNRCRWFAVEVLPEAERLRERLARYPSHRTMLRAEALEEAGWETLRGRGGRAKVVREVVGHMETSWAPSAPKGARVEPLRLHDLMLLLMGTQVWLDHLRRQPAGDLRDLRGQLHASNNGLGHLYDAVIGQVLDVKADQWPARRKAGMIHLTAELLKINEKTIRRRVAAALRGAA